MSPVYAFCFLLAAAAQLPPPPVRESAENFRVRPLANDYTIVFASPAPKQVYCYTPGIVRLASGRFVATLDLGGPGAESLPGMKSDKCTESGFWQGKILTSDDGGRTWTLRANFPGMHARPFVAGRHVYVLGQQSDLFILRSDDDGLTWTRPSFLTANQQWHQSACNVHYSAGHVHLVMERRVSKEIEGWPVGELAPVLMRARVDSDLRERASWNFASELPFQNAIHTKRDTPPGELFGVPFYPSPQDGREVAPGRRSWPMGWLETNVVEFPDPNHIWHDPRGKTWHLWMRCHTAGTGYAAIAKVVERDDGRLTTELVKAPSGKSMLFVPCPGGQMRFHVLYDEATRNYWLLSSQATDSMVRPDRLGPERVNLPNNERHRMQLHFSKNMIDWCFAGLVCYGDSPRQARHYASMAFDGEDLVIVSRSGDERAKNAHDGNLITFHRVREFRKLLY